MGMGQMGMGMGMGPPPGMVVMDWSMPENEGNVDYWVEDDVLPTPPVYEDMEMVIATTGNDSLVGKQGSSTQFQMIQGTSLGGTDTINGGGGTNMLTFQSLNNIHFVYDVTNGVINYANQANSITGNITVSNIQQIYADDGVSGSTLLDLSGATTGTGYILVGTNNVERFLSAAATTALNGSLGNIAADNVKGALIFGKGGGDIITAHPSGSMVLGGAGNDSISGGVSADLLQGGADDDTIGGGGGIDILSGGVGNDTFYFNVSPANNIYSQITDFTPGDDKFKFVVDYLGDGANSYPFKLTGTTLAASENNAATLNAANNAAKNLLIVTDAGGFASMAAAADAIDGATATGSALVAYFNSTAGHGQIYHDSDIGDTGGSTEILVATFNAASGTDVAALDATDNFQWLTSDR